jgi:hypothetical protein
MPTPRPRRATTASTAAVLAVLLTGATTALLLHSQPLNGRRRAVTTTQVTPARAPGHAAAPSPTPQAGPSTAPAIDLAGWRWADFHGIALPSSAQDGVGLGKRHVGAGDCD